MTVITTVETVNANLPRLTADQVLVAVEIVSLGSQTTDTVVKPLEYADAGIPHYWLIDLEALTSRIGGLKVDQ